MPTYLGRSMLQGRATGTSYKADPCYKAKLLGYIT
ncbi:unknown [Lactobacillus phage Lb338-1]|uniref:Uncharacterized protein n=1 Tax=Lactobacillus phage Lb338-1 TaxID=2892342 RepID=C1KFC1_9CAUD|nr:hypothetical protein lb338_phage_11 [Lactobacillus phage Lb338-1]ACO36932.1 unknown [Lactobacillus phage Lb338-1]